jgi:hypothetical protein
MHLVSVAFVPTFARPVVMNARNMLITTSIALNVQMPVIVALRYV